jgi:hypothetical protein
MVPTKPLGKANDCLQLRSVDHSEVYSRLSRPKARPKTADFEGLENIKTEREAVNGQSSA